MAQKEISIGEWPQEEFEQVAPEGEPQVTTVRATAPDGKGSWLDRPVAAFLRVS